MQYFNNILCIEASKLIKSQGNPEGLITKDHYDVLKHRNRIRLIRRSSFNTPALIEFDTLPSKFKEDLIQKFGDPHEQAAKKPFRDRIEADSKALEYFTSYRLEDGRMLPEASIKEYCNDAAILNAIMDIYIARQKRRAALGGSRNEGEFWTNALKALNDLRNDFPCTLPDSERRLRDKYRKYVSVGYEALISRKYCNDNSRKVSVQIENLLLSLYTMPNKPYGTSVHEMYTQFVNGKIQVYDQATGEIFNREDYMRNGAPIEISESTVWNYINKLLNRATVDKQRTGSLEYNTTHRPHHHRIAPSYSLSKISMDDRDLPRKMHDGNRVKAYYAYDVASGCIIGKAYSRGKDKELFVDCIRDMFRLIENNGFGVPVEVEVEHHLVNKFADTLMKAGNVFPFVRWCNPGNSQEKRAEHLNRQKKYSVEKDSQTGIGRFYAKLEANRPRVEKIDNIYKEKRYTYEQLIADDIETIKAFNNQLHPKQKKYPGLTRWQVLCQNINPNLAKIDNAILYKYIGEKTITSIRRNQYCAVQNEKYQIEKPEILSRLLPGNYEVEAYWLPDSEGLIDKVYLYQNDEFVCYATKIKAYNESTAEQTDEDKEAYTQQAKFVSHFDKTIKDRKEKLKKARIMQLDELEQIALSPVETVEHTMISKDDDIEKLVEEYDPREYRDKAFNSF
ncbi:MAG: hypothetical protein JXA77_04035 [Bacteroidales bacterium]|nr:hypothetical protein [Bacteroidales bacterium]